MTYQQIPACIVLCAAAIGAQAAPYGNNLVVGGDAESGTGAWTAYDGAPLFSTADYGSNWVLPSQPGPADRGAKLFVGGAGGPAYAAGYQLFDLSANAADIATGQVAYDLGGWLGGWTNQGDNAMVYVSFIGAADQTLGTASLGPVTPADRDNTTGLLFRETTGFLPSETTRIEFALSMERLNPSDNDGYADNLSFVLTAPAVPEPQTAALLLAGIAALGAIAGRRTR